MWILGSRWGLRFWYGQGPVKTADPCSPGLALQEKRWAPASDQTRFCPSSQVGQGRAGGEGWRGLRDSRLSAARSIHNGVIAVFQRKGLPDQELFSLNEGVR